MKIIKRLGLFFIIIFLILFCLDKILYLCDNDEEEIYENGYINELNSEKLTVETYQRSDEDYTILYKGETLGEKKKKRILVVGDSFVWPHCNRNINSMFWKRLQYLLEKDGYNDVEIVAAGASGLGTIDEVKLMLKNEEMMKNIDPDLIIVGFILNDYMIDSVFDENIIAGFDDEKFINDHYNNTFYKIIKKLFPNIYNSLINTLLYGNFHSDEFNKKYGSEYGYEFDYKAKLYRSDKYYKLFEEEGIKELANLDTPVFMYELFIGYSNDHDIEFLDMASNLAHKYNLPYYESREAYTELSSSVGGDVFQNDGDGHPSELLNDFYAQNLLEILKKDYTNIIGKKSKVKEFELSINDYLPYGINLEKIDDKTYSFTWPDKYLTYPLDTNYIKLNLKYPKNIKSISLESDNIKSSSVWYNKYNDHKTFIEVKNNKQVYEINDEVYSINIHIELKNNKDKKIILKLDY